MHCWKVADFENLGPSKLTYMYYIGRRSWPPFVWGARIYWTYSDFLNSFPTNEVDLHIIKCQRGPRPSPLMYYEDASSMSVDPASIPGLVPQQQQSGGVLDNVPQLRDKPWFVSWLMLSFIDLLNITRFKTAIQTLQGGRIMELSTNVLFTLHDIFMVISFLFLIYLFTYLHCLFS